jgi:hypothetical protein
VFFLSDRLGCCQGKIIENLTGCREGKTEFDRETGKTYNM